MKAQAMTDKRQIATHNTAEPDLFAFGNATGTVQSQIWGDEKPRANFAYTGWAFASLPHRSIQGDFYEKEIGPVKLSVTAGYLPDENNNLKKMGVPFGVYARLILIYIQTQAVKTGSAEIEFGPSFYDFLSRLDLEDGGNTRKLVWEQLLRLSASTIMFHWKPAVDAARDQSPVMPVPAPKAQARDQSPARFVKASIASEGMLAMHMNDPKQPRLWSDRITLTKEFFESITNSSVPLLEGAIKALGKNSLALDIYVWLAYRLRHLKEPLFLDWYSLHMQFGAEYAQVRDFKIKFIERVKQALAVYPKAKLIVIDWHSLHKQFCKEKEKLTDFQKRYISSLKKEQSIYVEEDKFKVGGLILHPSKPPLALT